MIIIIHQVMRREWHPPHRLEPFLEPVAEWAGAASVNLGDAAMLIKESFRFDVFL